MEIDVVGEDVSFGILQREFDVVPLVADHQRAGMEPLNESALMTVPLSSISRWSSTAVSSTSMTLGATGCHEFVGGCMRRGEELLFHPWQVVHFGGGGGVGCHGHHHRVDAGRGAKCAPASPEQLTSVHVEHG